MKVFNLENAYIVERAQLLKATEGGSEAIVKGLMADTPPGSSSTACCPKDSSGT
jgi:hypothetical protein